MVESKMAETLLEIDGIETCYGLSQVLFGLSLKVQSGEMVALMGRNGMGKTTTIRSIMGMTPARSGKVRFAGEEVRSLPSYKIAKLGIGLVPEGRQIFPNLTVYENLVAASGNRLGNPDPWTIEKIHALFPRLAERGSNMGVTLSGGEQQMLAIGRALMTNPKLLILDEATEGLAPLIREEIWNCLSMLKGRGQSVLVIDKNVANLSRIADRHYIIERGRTVWSGTSEQLIAEPELVLVEQSLNGLQFGLLLFLLAAGLTLVFGIMDFVNMAHGSLYMMGAYFAATFVAWTGSFVLGILLALGATLLLGIALEFIALRHLYGRDHLDQVLATFGLILFFNDAVRLIWGPAGLSLPLPAWLTVPVQIVPGVFYPAYRLSIIVVALAVAALLYVVVMRTRIGMLIAPARPTVK